MDGQRVKWDLSVPELVSSEAKTWTSLCLIITFCPCMLAHWFDLLQWTGLVLTLPSSLCPNSIFIFDDSLKFREFKWLTQGHPMAGVRIKTRSSLMLRLLLLLVPSWTGGSTRVVSEGSGPFQAHFHLLISHERQSRGVVDLTKWEGSWFFECCKRWTFASGNENSVKYSESLFSLLRFYSGPPWSCPSWMLIGCWLDGSSIVWVAFKRPKKRCLRRYGALALLLLCDLFYPISVHENAEG